MNNKSTVDKDVSALCILSDSSIRQAMKAMDRTAKGIILVVDEGDRLIDTVTDGDVRRAILAGTDPLLSVSELILIKQRGAKETSRVPFVAPIGTPPVELIRLMNKTGLRQIPLVDDQGRVMDLAVLSDLVRNHVLPVNAVVMAGGEGTRLRPLTQSVPKPMLPLGDRPLLERVIAHLRNAGISSVTLTTRYKAEAISSYFGDGRDFSVDITYVKEDQPLGTAGALALLEKKEEPTLVINGDILTEVDVAAMLKFHQEHHADMTVAVREYEHRLPYGVIETDGVSVVGVLEKPVKQVFVNAGIYLLEPAVVNLIPFKRNFDMTELIGSAVELEYQVVNFPIHEYWLDIGQHADYERAKDDLRILEHIEHDPELTRADLASRMGVAVGTANWYIKQLVNKGYLKVSRLDTHRLMYLITPEGLAEKTRLAMEYAHVSMVLYRTTRQQVVELLASVREAGYKQVKIEGESDLRDVCRLTCMEYAVPVAPDASDEPVPVLRVSQSNVELHMPAERLERP